MPVMIRGALLFLLLILLSSQCFAYELILPREKKSIVNTNYALFMGKANNSESIFINNENVYVAPNGAFAHSVKLKEGENRVVIRSNYNTQIYKFYKNSPVTVHPEEVCEFDTKPAIVIADNAPLRSSPVDYGLNRISHLFKDTTVLINGSKGNFYRVFLSKDKIAWIKKEYVDVNCVTPSEPAQFINMDSKRYKNASVQNISFTKNLPYTIEERDNEIIFRIYNPELSDTTVYTLNIPKPEKYTYFVTLNDGNYSFKVNAAPEKSEDYTVVIDAGHGGSEKGAIGCLGDEEKNVNLRIALELQERLKLMGINVVMTRECDGYISLKDRVKLAKEANANIFVSIHLNSIGDTPFNVHKNKGTSVYYYNPASKGLAEILEKSVSKAAGTRQDGVRAASFAVIRPAEYLGVLVEAAYMINPSDSVLYNSAEFAHNTAVGIADGILEFINK